MKMALLAALLLLPRAAVSDSFADSAQAAPEAPEGSWRAYSSSSRLFVGEIPAIGWWPMEEETATGSVFRLLGSDWPSGSARTTLSLRYYDKGTLGFLPIKQAVEQLRLQDKGTNRSISPLRPVRVSLGLARTFEIVETRRMPLDSGPSFEEEVHSYVAVIPVGEAYYLARLISSRSNYLNYRADFLRFIKSLRSVSAR